MADKTLVGGILGFIPVNGGIDIDKGVRAAINEFVGKLNSKAHLPQSQIGALKSLGQDRATSEVDYAFMDGLKNIGVPFRAASSIMRDEKISGGELMYTLAVVGAKLPDGAARPSQDMLKKMGNLVASRHGELAEVLKASGMTEADLIKSLAKTETTLEKQYPHYAAALNKLPQLIKEKGHGDASIAIGVMAADLMSNLYESMKSVIPPDIMQAPGGIKIDPRKMF